MIEIDISQVRKMTGIDDVSATPVVGQVSTAQIEYYNTIADLLAKKRIGNNLEATTVTETYDGNGTDQLLLDHYPVSSVTSLTIAPTYTSTAATQTEGTDFVLYAKQGLLRMVNTTYPYLASNLTVTSKVFTKATQNVVVSYTYYRSDLVELARSLIFYMVCIDVLIDSGNEISEGVSRAVFDEYVIDYKGMPYDAQIKHFQNQINIILGSMGRKIYSGVV